MEENPLTLPFTFWKIRRHWECPFDHSFCREGLWISGFGLSRWFCCRICHCAEIFRMCFLESSKN